MHSIPAVINIENNVNIDRSFESLGAVPIYKNNVVFYSHIYKGSMATDRSYEQTYTPVIFFTHNCN
jgi:hypothetical protein